MPREKPLRHLRLLPLPAQPMLPFPDLPPVAEPQVQKPGQKSRPLVVRKLANMALARIRARDAGKPLPVPGVKEPGE